MEKLLKLEKMLSIISPQAALDLIEIEPLEEKNAPQAMAALLD